jgi:post-segregation antitoxin (ccd killing protein)
MRDQAEKRWREERKGAISAAKQHLSDTLEKSAQVQHRGLTGDGGVLSWTSSLGFNERACASATRSETMDAFKRPVVNQAEKRWREERKGAISAAKQHLSDTLENLCCT